MAINLILKSSIFSFSKTEFLFWAILIQNMIKNVHWLL